MNRKHRKTLGLIFENPIRADIDWKDVEALFIGLGAEVTEGKGSRVRAILHGVRIVLHQPHPRKEAGRATVKDIRDFLVRAGVR